MFQTDDLAIDHFKDVPGFKGLLKAVLKHQIQVLIEQLSRHADEETIVLSASVSDGGLSYLGSVAAKDFLEEKEEIKIQFLRHCIKKRHRANTEATDDYLPTPATTFLNNQFDQPTYSPPVDQGIYHTDQPSRHKARKLSHPQHIKPARQFQEAYHHEQGIDLSNHSVRKSRQPSEERDHGSSPAHRRKHSSPPLSIVKVEPAADPDLIKFEESLESETEVKIARTSAEAEGNSDSLPTDLTKEGMNFTDDTGQQGFLDSMCGISVDMNTNGTSGQTAESLSVTSQGLEQHHGSMFDQLQGLGLVNPALSQAYSYRPQPTKKRVYRKVECDICHKQIYITNIKVHKLRHMKNSISMG